MARQRRLAVAVGLVALTLVPVSQGVARASTVTKNVVFKSFVALDGTTDTLGLDVYTPGTAPPPGGYPTIFGIHGARDNGDKGSMAAEADIFAQDGFLVVAPNYRLNCDPAKPPPKVDPLYCGFLSPSQINDLEDAVRFMLAPQQVSTYSVDVHRLGAFGTSAGATLADLLGTLDYGVPKLQGVASLSGETELWLDGRSPEGTLIYDKDVQYIGCDYPGNAACNQAWYDASPQTSLTPDDPPLYQGNGKYEQIPLANAMDTAALADSIGVPNFLRVVPGVAHGSNMEDDVVGPNGTTVMDEVVSFFDTYVTGGAQADLSLSGSVSPDNVSAGTNLTYVFTATDQGPQFATGVTFADTLPVGVTLVSATPSQGTCSGTTTVSCSLGLVPPPSGATVTVVARVNGPGSIVISATASESGASSDPVGTNNSVTLNSTAVAQATADVSVSLVAGPNPITAGSNLTYTATAANNGPDSVGPVTLTDVVQAGTTVVSVSPSQGSCSTAAGIMTTISCAFGALALGTDAIATIVVTPGAPGAAVNTVTVSGNAVDANSANNTASATTTVNPAPGVVYVSLLDSGSSPKVPAPTEGQLVQWTLPTSDVWGHSATEHDGFRLPLFDSGVLEPGWHFAYTFSAAGTYTLQDVVTNGASKIQVGLIATPTTGGVGTVFTITWASQTAPTGSTYDAQIKRPGSTWTNWTTGTTAPSGIFVPDSGTGKYQFRARLGEGSVRTAWSLGTKITVK